MRSDSRADTRKKLQTLKLRAAATGENLRGSLWFMPSLMVIVTLLLAGSLARVGTDIPQHPVADLFIPASVDGARAVLQVVAGSVVTVTSVVFSLTVVALQMSATNYSPRVLRTFLRSRGTKAVLGIFLSTFAYSFVILHNVESRGGDAGGWSPQLAVGLLVPFVLASLVALVFFIHHVTQSIRVDTILRDVLEETVGAIEKVYESGNRSLTPLAELIPERARPIRAQRTGYVQAVNPQAMVDRISEHDVVIALRPVLGDYVVEDSVVGWAWRKEDHTGSDPDGVDAVFDDAVHFGTERTMQQDVPFGLRQLVDVAVRALSPGVNDPNTAIAVLSHLTKAYVLLAQKDLGHRVYTASGEETCLIVPGPNLEEYLHIATQQISYYGRSDVMVLERLLRMLGEVNATSGGAHAEATEVHVERVVEQAEKSLDLERDLEFVRQAAAHALKGTPDISHLTRAG